MSQQLQGKVALVTGASSGIGEATAVALAEAGAAVAIGARRADRLAGLAQRLTDAGARVLTLDLDVTDEASCRAAVAATVSEFGGLDVLVNNAGVMLLGRINGADTTDWTRMVNTNVLGLMFMTHAALPHLVERKGAVVQMSSTAGRTVRAGTGVYNATKWGVNAFSESLRQEVYQDGVRVVVVEPGIVATELREHITDADAKASIVRSAESIRQLQPEDIANAVVWAVTQPAHVSVNEILVRPTDQGW
ncbi:SDR family NAD(P)-dependent oxidoreductase [Goodfellowiella coeruleoviolacea]|uniref:NADP-dependent 3-hydroxy acid dehydrogenase YdfG n=1 Tax=Goodfellowiella coeruleoviolacea TaxID=334858 RepID=A0AAE3GJ53_9PSEU|nr:SDR family NAD(P)-dependent oxidoreductase [Goodfellowiella coeruleoviolacea]MCP2169171.1 NADP-dependent 3-hydroxy acid dehydrogenase YdfG [Goodfellowiella coeruleoviolacea]